MGAVANTVALMQNASFRDWVKACMAYQARTVILEDSSTPNHDVRMALALIIINNPNTYLEVAITVLAVDPTIATKGATPEIVTESVLLAQTAAAWTKLAEVLTGT